MCRDAALLCPLPKHPVFVSLAVNWGWNLLFDGSGFYSIFCFLFCFNAEKAQCTQTVRQLFHLPLHNLPFVPYAWNLKLQVENSIHWRRSLCFATKIYRTGSVRCSFISTVWFFPFSLSPLFCCFWPNLTESNLKFFNACIHQICATQHAFLSQVGEFQHRMVYIACAHTSTQAQTRMHAHTHTHAHTTVLIKDKSSLKTQLDWGAQPTKKPPHTDVYCGLDKNTCTHTHTHRLVF